ncbi:hypothetical protein ACJ73_06725 [Blastomyces percursus]|uniref:Methyltransferase type 11 domain-containing protein n=1 Tax=Blastomyces percursus TaxID=1658174 RepID=A0A1J9Q046_9EURO|nr:hypothetical protein ACJ73_06725 [Blastomyces percursus]
MRYVDQTISLSVFITRREKFASGQDIIFNNSTCCQGTKVDNVVHIRYYEDSSFGDNDGQSTTTSLESNAMRYSYENGRLPPNVGFELDNIEEDWSYKRPFDFIHSRHLASAVTDWPRLVRQAYQNLNPGGWVEFCDYGFRYRADDGSLTPGLAMIQNQNLVMESSQILGREPCAGPKLKRWVEDAGFVNVTERCFPLPIGVWAKDKKLKGIGWWNQLQFLQGVEAWSMTLLTHVFGWKPQEAQVHVAYTRNNARNVSIHAYYTVCVTGAFQLSLLNSNWPSVSLTTQRN